ncbi:MAG: hypothetical protein EA427_01170 [Spirochaetaceae bacterium]|nr:MAG: hypothetical protein EA427_01170 [Spirochaetaceae bacterium]
MGFSVSDIIILLIVAVVLAVYRKLDHNNRSLEKVKRFVERVQGEMDEIVAEKVTMLKDIGIEVDVHQRAAKEILKRIQSIEEDLTSRTDNLEQIGTRLSAYEKALDELIAMTGRAEENTARVRDESEYIDKVGKRIKSVQAKIEELENSLPGIVSGFEKQNTGRLNEVEARLFQESQSRIEGLEIRVDAAAGRVQEFSEDAARIQTETDETSREALRTLQEMYDNLVGGLREELDDAIESAKHSFESVRETIGQSVMDAREQFDRYSRDGDDQLDRLRESFSTLVDETEERLEQLARDGQNLETESLRALRAHLERSSEELRREIDGRHQEVVARQTEQLSHLEENLRDQVSRFTTQLQEQEEQFSERIRQLAADSRSLNEEASGSIRKDLAESMTRIREEMEGRALALRETVSEQLEETRARGESETADLREMFSRIRNDADDWGEKTKQLILEMEQQVEHLQRRTREQEEQQTDSLARHMRETEEQLSNYRTDITTRLDRLDATAEERLSGLSVRLGEIARDLEERFSSLQAGNEERLHQLGNEHAQAHQEIQERYRAEFAELAESIRGRSAQLEELATAAQSDVQTLQTALDEGRAEIETKIKDFGRSATRRINSSAQDIEQRLLGDVEARLTDYEKELGYRFSRIEAVNTEVDELEQNLRNTMERVSERVRGDFLAFGEELRGLREQDRKEAHDGMDGLRTSMRELEEGLNELKQRAYDNVSEKLKVFEDEFFTDLRERSSAMEAQIASWRNEVDSRLTALRKEYEDERIRAEEEYSEEIRSGLHQFQESANAQLTKIDTQLDSFRGGIGSRMESAEQSLVSFEETVSEELVSLKDRSFQAFRQEFSQLDNRIREELKGFEGEMEEQVAQVRRAVGTGKEELESMVEAARSDVAVWQTRVLNELRSSDAEVSNQLADARVRLSENVQELKREFSAEREQLVEQSLEQRRAIRDELDSNAAELERQRSQLEEQGRTSLEELTQRYHELRNRTDTHEKQMLERLDEQSGQFRSLVNDTRDQFQAMREKLLGKLEEEARTLGTTVQEIEKRQRGFIEQTGIFERADSLKVKLQDDIEELKNEIARVEALRGEVRDIEGQFNKIRKMSTDAGEKMARFTADKRRIDLLEEDYRRLISLAQSVETKIEQVGTSDDQLAEITARLKSLDELQQEVDARFDRMEKRRTMIDETTDGIEQNRLALGEVQSQIGTLAERIEQFPEIVAKLSGQLKQVAAHRKETEAAVGNLATLNETLADVERRMEELKTAREWLARTETRLEEIRREAGEQVKLLGTIMRDETKKSGGADGGAPSLSARETVQKLAHQGWNVDEIARATKMSKGEVELILELSTRK